MEKILQILIVFALMMFAISWFIRGRDRRYHDYTFAGRFTFPLSGDWQRDLLTATVARALDEDHHLSFRAGEVLKTLEIVDELQEVVTDSIALDWNADIILFDPGAQMIFCGSVEGAVTIIRQVSPEVYKTVQRMAVPQDCTALSLDRQNGKLYVHVGPSVFVYTNG